MLKLGDWQESVSKGDDEQRRRVSDLIQPTVTQDEPIVDRRISKGKETLTHDDNSLMNELHKLQKKETIHEQQFWFGFNQYINGMGISPGIICVQALSDGIRLTEDLFRIHVIDVEYNEKTLYLSIGWLRDQRNLPDRSSFTKIMNGRSLDQGLMQEEVLCLYDPVITSDTIFVDKFYMYLS